MRAHTTLLAAAAIAASACGAICGHTTANRSTLTGSIRLNGQTREYRVFQPIGADQDRVDVRWEEEGRNLRREVSLRFTDAHPLNVGTFTLESLGAQVCDTRCAAACVSQCTPIIGTLSVTRFAIDACAPGSRTQAGCPVHLDGQLQATGTGNAGAVALDLTLHEDDQRVAYTHCLADRFGK